MDINSPDGYASYASYASYANYTSYTSYRMYTEKVTSGAIWWPYLQLMQVAPSGGQICNSEPRTVILGANWPILGP